MKWEYKVVEWPDTKFEWYLNQFGAEGWELIDVAVGRLIFKRRKPDDISVFMDRINDDFEKKHSGERRDLQQKIEGAIDMAVSQ